MPSKEVLLNNTIEDYCWDAPTLEEARNSSVVRGRFISISEVGGKYYVIRWYSHTQSDYDYMTTPDEVYEDDVASVEVLAVFDKLGEAEDFVEKLWYGDE